MGGGPIKETLLFVFSEDEPKHITNALRAQFPDIELILHQVQRWQTQPSECSDVSPPPWHKATILVTPFQVPPTVESAPNLKWIQLLSAGIDHIVNHPIYKETDIVVTTASGIHGPTIAEWVLMTALDLTKNYNGIHDQQKQHKWDSRRIGLARKRNWNGKTVGIAGYGSIGRQVGRVFNAMGCKIHAYTAASRTTPESRHDNDFTTPGTGDPDGTIPEAWYSGPTKTGLHTFLASGLDLLVISLPLTPATRGLFGAEEFEVLYTASLDKIKNDPSSEYSKYEDTGCIVSNIARGPIIQTAALIEALKQRKLQGACLDVTDPEPLPEDSELWDMDNAIVTPHLSGEFANYFDRAFEIVIENLRRRERGESMVNVVRRKRGY